MQARSSGVAQLIDAKSKEEVASQRLASGSLVHVTADDNGWLVQGRKRLRGEPKVLGTRYLHSVPKDIQTNQSINRASPSSWPSEIGPARCALQSAVQATNNIRQSTRALDVCFVCLMRPRVFAWLGQRLVNGPVRWLGL
mmetsp:Transcript_13409/g.30473  ORF Transcript_13409/g.30473 Transcript_13409/m.30473 type:complete len:140 (-) Transcript_13409:53-472(-)